MSFFDDLRKSASKGTGIFSWPKAIADNSYGGIEIKPKVTHKIADEDLMKIGGGILLVVILIKNI